MQTDRALDEIITLLGNYLDGVEVIGAYPDRTVYTRLEERTVAVGFCGADMSPSSIDGGEKSGEVKIFADIFVPLSYGSAEAFRILTDICRALSPKSVVSVSAERLSFDRALSAYTVKSAIGLSGRIALGGDGNE